MARKISLAEAYWTYGCVKRRLASWSARSKDGKTVAISMWIDGINNKATPITYGSIGEEDISIWEWRQGNKDRIEDLKWAREHCLGRLRVIITIPKDFDAKTREVEDCIVRPDLIMHLDELNEETGEFRATLIEGTY